MRKFVITVSAIALGACQPETEPAAPNNIVAALAPYYEQLDVERPQALPGAGEPAADTLLQTILFGSCHSTDRPLDILDTIVGQQGDLFIYTGDNVYGDAYSWDPSLPELRSAYSSLAASEPFRNLRQSTPILATWDDHDYGMNDFGAQFPFKGFAEELFLEFWGVAEEDERRSRPGIYTSRTYGPDGQRVQIILLDTRYFRGALARTPQRNAVGMERYVPTEDTNVTMLGEEQWSWLAETLREPADVRLVVSSIQVLADGHGWEAWRTMPHERDRLFETIEASGADGVVLVSGDRHSSGLYLRDDVIGYPLYEITSSALNMSYGDENNEPGPNRIGEMYAPANFGAIEVDWANRNLSLEIRDGSGETVRQQSIALDTLTRN
ncbi:alkaline phosphatase D family protein [Maricaulis sp.]|uniref:alkaline phosphatase D family protein n=1 Tax=unclassified Maricaulis TaxID=2632371 RepID=UPI001B2A4007|nr:alkaline phosphatase D family protein [Maricaulis sp.]MBO6795610.1 alkaline phosphatase family protein [Maricaulis sp.]